MLSSPPPLSTESGIVKPQQTANTPQMNSEVPPQRAETKPTIDTDLSMPELTAYDVINSEEVDFPHILTKEYENTQPFLRHCIRGSKSNPFYQENDSDLDSPLSDYKASSIDSLVMMVQEESMFDVQKECDTTTENSNVMDLEEVCPSSVDGSCPKVFVNSEIVEHLNGISSVRTAEGTYNFSCTQDLDTVGSSPAVNQNREILLGVQQTLMGNPNELTVVSPLQGCSPMPTFSFEPLRSPEGPVIIQNLRITGTITAKEHRGTGSHPYTLYTIKVRRFHNLQYIDFSFLYCSYLHFSIITVHSNFQFSVF